MRKSIIIIMFMLVVLAIAYTIHKEAAIDLAKILAIWTAVSIIATIAICRFNHLTKKRH